MSEEETIPGYERYDGRSGYECVGKVPEGEAITGVVSHKGKIYVSTKTNLYVAVDDNQLEKIELKWIDDSKCEHGKELDGYCEPCGRIHGGDNG